MIEQLTNVLKVLNLAERLKRELRHSWLSDGRRESVAEHSWRLALMVVLISPHLDKKIDQEKAIKMAIIHDLVEAITGDIPTFEITDKQLKQQQEIAASELIRDTLGGELGQQLHTLFLDYEMQTSHEAKVVHALDKVEMHLQHNEAPMDTWLDWEISWALNDSGKHCEFDQTLLQLNQLVKQQTLTKLASHKIDHSVFQDVSE